MNAGRHAWGASDLRWGIWDTHESRLGLLQGVGTGDNVIELGCGTASVSAYLARKGAHTVAVDIAPKQVLNVQALQVEFELPFPIVCANAEQVPYDDDNFDLAISEYGASLWCDPPRWLAEAHRLLRRNGRLIFFTNAALLMVCTPADGGVAGEMLVRDYFAEPRVDYGDDGPVEFHITHGEWVRHLRSTGFALENLIETRPRLDAQARFGMASVEWARRWPSEEIWIARRES